MYYNLTNITNDELMFSICAVILHYRLQKKGGLYNLQLSVNVFLLIYIMYQTILLIPQEQYILNRF